MKEFQSPSGATPPKMNGAVVLRPVVFVVDATRPPPATAVSGSSDGRVTSADEPFDVQRSSSAASAIDEGDMYDSFLLALRGKIPGGAATTTATAADEEISLAPSYASSSGPFNSPTRAATGDDDFGGGDGDDQPSSSLPDISRRFLSLPSFTRNLHVNVGRWKATSPRKQNSGNNADDDHPANNTDISMMTTHVLAQDMEDDPDDDTAATAAAIHPSSVSALNSYSKQNQPVHFMSKRARIVSVSSRHAFPPSKFPRGKLDPNSNIIVSSSLSSSYNSGGGGNYTMMLGEKPPPGSSSSGSSGAWVSSYEIQNEGILPSGWMEKHARALPSAIIVVTTLVLHSNDNDRLQQQQSIGNAVRTLEMLRATLAEKRSTPFHLVCLLKEENVGVVGRGQIMAHLQTKIDTIREQICQQCGLPQSQVFLIKMPHDLEPDEFESGILRSPYINNNNNNNINNNNNNNNNNSASSMSPSSSNANHDATIIMSPLLRQLDRSLRDTSAMYYSRLAEAQERKLLLWRNRFHTTNASFELNTLLAAMRCARYAIKVGTLRELQLRTGGGFLGPTGGVEGGIRWTDKSSLAMSHYDEAYRWLVELHQRAISWRAISMAVSSASTGKALTYPSPVPKTPGEKTYSMDDIKSPTFSESPGGGIGVELSLPGSEMYLATAPPPPSLIGATPPTMRRDSPALTSKKGYVNTENIAFFASLWEQCRAVASMINMKLLRSTTTPLSKSAFFACGTEAEEQWNRHRTIFLSNPQGVPGFHYNKNDDFFGPVWHRSLYVTEEMLTYACVTEGRWRRALELHAARTMVAGKSNNEAAAKTTLALTPSYHQPGAPWRAYGELCEAVLGLRRVVLLESSSGGHFHKWLPSSSAISSRRKFVGSVASGSSGFGTMSWRFESVSTRDHRAMALDYVLHALDLLDIHLYQCCNVSTESSLPSTPAELRQPMSSARLHYLAARLFMSLGDPLEASVHLKIASSQTKSWPSLQLSIQRALIACADRPESSTKEYDPPSSSSVLSNAIDVKDSCIEILIHPEKCKLLSPNEAKNVQEKAWKAVTASVVKRTLAREVTWTQYDSSKSVSPFEFAVSFLGSTHALSGDSVPACVSLKSRLGFPVIIASIQLITPSGLHEVPNNHCCVEESALRRPLQRANLTRNDTCDLGVSFEPNDLKFFFTDISLPAKLSDVLVGDTSSDASKFTPKNCRLCNMGFSHAAGNICEMRIENKAQPNTIIDGKPVPASSISQSSSSFLGGIPWVCTGVVLTLKRIESDVPIKLQIQCPGLFSPLLRTGALKFMMEESNYTSHSWSRPAHHPLCLGPRILRVLGPRPQMHVTNLTRSLTECKLVMGTVNRIMFRLDAGKDEDCWDLRVKLKSTSSKKQVHSNIESAPDSSVDDRRNHLPIFVCRAGDPTVMNVTESGVALPVGWEPRKDIGSDEYLDSATSISHYLGARKSLHVSFDVFYPSDQSFSSLETCNTSYEATFMYNQVRVGKQANPPHDVGDQVTVIENGSFEWISPFTVEFSQMNGHVKSFPCGIQHASNMVSQSDPVLSSAVGSESIASDGERIQMRFSLGVKSLGSQIAAKILYVSNEMEMNESRKELYSAGIGVLTDRLKQGSALSMSYSVLAQKDVESGKEYGSISLGVMSVDWKPVSLSLPEGSSPITNPDEFGSAHGPLQISNQPSMIFHGPQCTVLDSPFMAKLLKCPATPKVGTPFCISYLVTNRSAKRQAVVVHVNEERSGNTVPPPAPQLLGTGKFKEELELAPFEEKEFSYTFISMLAGKVLRPSLRVSSNRHKTWVVNETPLSPRYLFVLP